VEEELVRPVLRLLGHTFEVQPALATPEGTRRPDYVLYRDAGSVALNKGKTLTDEVLKGKAFAIADAKYWERSLDVSLKGGNRDAFSNKNPSYQVSFYMQHSGTEWGILTNGRFWRLYHRDTAHKLDRFYEVDLPALARSGGAEDFLYFYASSGGRLSRTDPSVSRRCSGRVQTTPGASATRSKSRSTRLCGTWRRGFWTIRETNFRRSRLRCARSTTTP